jgi:hypothetical protein
MGDSDNEPSPPSQKPVNTAFAGFFLYRKWGFSPYFTPYRFYQLNKVVVS